MTRIFLAVGRFSCDKPRLSPICDINRHIHHVSSIDLDALSLFLEDEVACYMCLCSLRLYPLPVSPNDFFHWKQRFRRVLPTRSAYRWCPSWNTGLRRSNSVGSIFVQQLNVTTHHHNPSSNSSSTPYNNLLFFLCVFFSGVKKPISPSKIWQPTLEVWAPHAKPHPGGQP